MVSVAHEQKHLLNAEERLTVLNCLTIVRKNLGDPAGFVGFDFIEDFHGLDDADGFALFDLTTEFSKGFGARAG